MIDLRTELEALKEYISEERFHKARRQAKKIKNAASKGKKEHSNPEKWLHVKANMIRVIYFSQTEDGKEKLRKNGIPNIDPKNPRWRYGVIESDEIGVSKEDTIHVLQKRISQLEQELQSSEKLLLEMYEKLEKRRES